MNTSFQRNPQTRQNLKRHTKEFPQNPSNGNEESLEKMYLDLCNLQSDLRSYDASLTITFVFTICILASGFAAAWLDVHDLLVATTSVPILAFFALISLSYFIHIQILNYRKKISVDVQKDELLLKIRQKCLDLNRRSKPRMMPQQDLGI